MSKNPDSKAETLYQLAKVWRIKGNSEAAVAGYKRVLQVDPQHRAALIELADLLITHGFVQETLPYYEKALALEADDPALQIRYDYAKRLLADPARAVSASDSPHTTPQAPAHSNPQGKIDLRQQLTFKPHRSGWAYALAALMPLHNQQGVLFDGFLERNFAWRHIAEGVRPADVLQRLRREGTFDDLATSEEKGITPYTRPWVGVLHNPPAMPIWYHYHDSPQTILAKKIWRQSMTSCMGLFALSEYQGQWLREQTGKPVSVLTFPTEIPTRQFSFSEFRANRQKKVVQIGWWLRKMSAIYQLPLGRDNSMGYKKIRLVPRFFGDADNYLRQLLTREIQIYDVKIDPAFGANTREMQHLPDEEYDRLLSANIAFVELYDASANNAVVECIARATPLLINKLPAVVEYLGEDYPFYFNDLAEAAAKALDLALIHDTHVYLANCPARARLSGDYFRRSFENSEVYQLL